MNEHQTHQNELVKHRLLGATGRDSGLAGLEWGWRICVSNKLSGDGDAAGRGPTILGERTTSKKLLETLRKSEKLSLIPTATQDTCSPQVNTGATNFLSLLHYFK